MLKLAIKYKDELDDLFREIAFKDKYKFYEFNNFCYYEVKLSDNSWDDIELVSVDKQDNVIGFFRAGISRTADKVSSLGVVNFYDTNFEFSKDLSKFIIDLFEKYNFRKIEFCVVIGNPAEKMYDKFIRKYNGRIIGIQKENVKLWDGSYYDVKLYEIFRDEFLNREKTMNQENDELENFKKFVEAEEEAFKKAGIKTGRVEFTCPICGGKAVGVRELHHGRISGMGSGCSGCNMNHT